MNVQTEREIKVLLSSIRRNIDRVEELMRPKFDPSQIEGWVKDKELAPLIKAIAKAESNFDPNAVSSAGAEGLCQLMPAIQKHFGVTDPFDPKQSVEACEKLIMEELDRFNDKRLALAAYNAGSPRVRRAIHVAGSANNIEKVMMNLPQETQMYVPKVLHYYEMYKS